MEKERKAITKWTKHGYTALASPDDRTYNTIVICMDLERNHGPTEDENDTKVTAYIDHRTPYSRIILNHSPEESNQIKSTEGIVLEDIKIKKARK